MIGLIDNPILLSMLIPLLGAGLILLTGKYPNLRETVTLMTAAALFWNIFGIYQTTQTGQVLQLELFEPLAGLPIAFKVEPLGMLFALIASFLWIVTSIYAIGYMRGHHEQNQTRFYFFFAIAIASVMGLTFSGNLLTLFVFYEILTLSTFPLVTHAGTDKARNGGRVYLGILLGTSIAFFLLAIIITYVVSGTLEFKAGGILPASLSPTAVAVLYGLFLFGVGKAALMPFHRWLPAAMVAPTPVSALLHAVAVVKAGVFSVLKITVYVFGIESLQQGQASQWMLYVAGATVLFASLIAMTKDNLKARLAYSTVSQLAYIVLGAALAHQLGIIGGAMHIPTHAFGKITLFFAAGAILVASHKTDISQMRGLGRVMPITFGAMLIGCLSIIGLPPLGGTWSKWYLVMATVETEQWIMLGVLLVSSLLNIAYLLPIPIRAFYGGDNTAGKVTIKEAPLMCLLAM
ncbi:MAG: hypothetical protein JKY89_11440, partial [Immundisolibacteraceae bacterium]|nr:hypothetical protein [Immundisolibacteraceae bacterium]